MDIGPSEAEAFWTAFLRRLQERGLRGVKLVVSDAHEGLKAAVAKLRHASWQPPSALRRIPWPACKQAGRSWRPSSPPPSPRTTPTPPRASEALPSLVGVPAAPDRARCARWSPTVDGAAIDRPTLPSRRLMDDSEADVLAYMAFPAAHQPAALGPPAGAAQRRIKRRTIVVGLGAVLPTPHEAAITAWSAPSCSSSPMSGRSRHPLMILKNIAPLGETADVSLPVLAA